MKGKPLPVDGHPSQAFDDRPIRHVKVGVGGWNLPDFWRGGSRFDLRHSDPGK